VLVFCKTCVGVTMMMPWLWRGPFRPPWALAQCQQVMGMHSLHTITTHQPVYPAHRAARALRVGTHCGECHRRRHRCHRHASCSPDGLRRRRGGHRPRRRRASRGEAPHAPSPHLLAVAATAHLATLTLNVITSRCFTCSVLYVYCAALDVVSGTDSNINSE
jgi:hypothetical protein